MSIQIRLLVEPEELDAIVDLEIAIWGVIPRDATPMNLMRPVVQHGGVALGAFSDEQMVGMALGLPLRHNGHWILWSHMTGVHPDFQAQGIGFQLKLAQRDWALDHGFSEMRWTFDPLQRGNARFNLQVLGATADTYHIDYYGTMNDAINRNAASDRIEASWKLKSARVKALASGKPPKLDMKRFAQGIPLLEPGAGDAPRLHDIHTQNNLLLAAVPRGRTLPWAESHGWRTGLRQALQAAFSRGYAAIDFFDDGDYGWYVLQAPKTWYLYVLRCADSSLYTGITPDLAARLARHQSGRGAAYTATRRPVEMIGAWAFGGRSEALKAELAFKRQTRATKLSRVIRQESFQGAAFVETSRTE